MASERGSVLMLMPAAVVIVIILAAIAVDRAVVFGAQRDLVATAEAAANDAVAAGVDPDVLHAEGRIELSTSRVQAEIDRVVSVASGRVGASWHLDGQIVVVELEREVPLVFSPAGPGGQRRVVVRATGRGELRRRG